MDAYLLGLDLGTTGIKAALFAASDGRTITSATIGYKLSHPHPGWAEQDPQEWWEATVQAISRCVAQAQQQGITADQIRATALSGQMHGAVLLDDQWQPVRPCIIWSDQRCQGECDAMTERVGQERLIDLVSNPALPGFTAPKLLWVHGHEPENWARVRHVLLPKDYIRFRLTGENHMEISDAAGTCLLDVVHGVWSQPVLADLDLDPALFPPLIASTAIAGRVTPEVATLTGLTTETLVAGGGADNACGAVGAGIVQTGQALLSIGTSGVLLAYSAVPQVDRSGPVPRAHTFNHAVPDAWYLMGVTQAAGLSLRWFRDHVWSGTTEGDPYDQICAEAATVPPGSDGLIFLPYLQGERTPILDAEARGGWIGLTARHTRAHLSRAVLEGVAWSLRDCLEVVQASGVAIEEVRATGGGARNAVWRQIFADTLGLPVKPLQQEEGPAFGAALLAGVAAGLYPSVPDACAQTVRTGEAVQPDPVASRRYQQSYLIYQSIYPALRATMHDMAAFERT